MKKNYKNLRSYRWFAPNDIRSFGHRSRAMQIGYSKDDWYGKPIVGIINTWSDIQPCHIHFKSRVEDVKRGIFQMGGFPIELPSISLAEMYVKPTTMLYRNMLSMEVEELIRSHPIDGVVLMGGCDKTTPALLMGAISNDLPTMFLPAGPMLRGNFKGKFLGSGSDGWKYWAELRAGNISDDDWQEVETGIARSYGHCMTMGTASTMTAIAEAIGFCLPGASSIPAPDSNHIRMSSNVGKRIVEMVWQDLKPSKFVTKKSIENAIIVAMAMGCSTNAIIHLIAIARRSGIRLTMDKLDEIGRKVPVIANIRPSGKEYLMEDFYYAGGILSLMYQLSNILNINEKTVVGKKIKEIIKKQNPINQDVIRPLKNPIYKEGSLAVLKGNLAPDGCVIKPAACEKKFLKHKGPVIVFDSYPEMNEIIDSKKAVLHYKKITDLDRYTVLEITLETGRHHQIRSQLTKIGFPIRGDLKYGAKRSNPDGSIDLHARSLSFDHPTTKERINVVAPPLLNLNGTSLFPINHFGFFANDFSHRAVFNFTFQPRQYIEV